MCGIAGVIAFGSRPIATEYLKQMCDVLAHRGPDDAGYLLFQSGRQNAKRISYYQNFADSRFANISPMLPVIDEQAGQKELHGENWNVFLGHRRLSVIDRSPAGHQPMSDKSKSVWIVYNGEIYNFRELREELIQLGYEFRSKSDTEVILSAYQEWGIDCVGRFNGMFAIAIWDNREKILHLARDRYGTKPLYYTLLPQGALVFASEIKSILEYGEHSKELNASALGEYFTFQNLFRSETLFKNIHLLPAATIATATPEGSFSSRTYWDYDFSSRDESISFEEAREETLRLFTAAVERQLVADVQVGSYLSGGMDSGSITAVAARFIPRLSTFTAGFELSKVTGIEATFDERRDAELIANEFKTEHFEQVINAGDISWIMPKLIWHQEDLRVGMCYSNYYISRLASKFVTVCLSGAGGDELYGGYPWRYYRVVNSLDQDAFFKNYYGFWQRLVKDEEKRELFKESVIEEACRENPFQIFKGVFTDNAALRYLSPEDHIANSLYFEAKTFLHGLLTVGDKLSMANSLEERFPFLDNNLVDFAMKVPIRHKLKNFEEVTKVDENEVRRNARYFMQHDDGKNVLRESMKSLLPEQIINRKKQGFSSPDESWFRGENFQYVNETLTAPNTKFDRYIDKGYVRKVLNDHAKGTNHRLLIWSLISFEEWCRQFGM